MVRHSKVVEMPSFTEDLTGQFCVLFVDRSFHNQLGLPQSAGMSLCSSRNGQKHNYAPHRSSLRK